MHIVIAIDSFNDANGGTIATKRLVKELRKRGHKVSIIAAVHENPSDPDFYKIPGFVLPGAEASLENMKFLFGRNDYKVYEKAMKDADIVQVQFPFLMAKGAVKAAKRLGKPVVGAFHVQPQNIMAALGKTSKLLERFLWFTFKYFLFKRVDTIISPSKFASELLISEGVKVNHKVISNGIPKEYVHKHYERPAWFGDNLVLINIGRHADEKRQSLLIEGVKRSKYKKNIQLILAGRGERTEVLKAKGKELPVEPVIEYISDEDKLKYLNTADLYVHASIVELESLSTSEAIGCGLPCLISDSRYSAASQFALDERFLFEEDNPDDFAKKIDYWYENKEELRSDAMKKRVLAEADWYRFDRAVNEYEAFIEEIVHPSEREVIPLEPEKVIIKR
ncbi:MAG: glycosyltransferase family 4 protein [Chlorobi bacterium]|nr:glycosyltransferase family 4 protein [Chlorobiota bacterium]